MIRRCTAFWSEAGLRWLWIGCLGVAVVLGALQAWSLRNVPAVGDAVSYLDIGDALIRGDWTTGINSYWSPLYPLVLGFTRAAISPGRDAEYAIVRLANFLLYIIALTSFETLLREVQRSRSGPQIGPPGLPPWSWLVMGYSLFLWTSLDLIKLSQISPDLAVAAVVYLACALLLRIRRNIGRRRDYVALGALLGVGYWTKAPLFPLAGIFLALAAFASRSRAAAITNTLVAVTVFLAVSAPLVITLSQRAGHLTFGDSARLNYAWYVGGVRSRHWRGSPETGTPVHPMEQIMARPEVYVFSRELPVTYPLWHDPAYWYDGMRYRFNLPVQFRTTASIAIQELKVSLGPAGAFAFGVFILLVVGWSAESRARLGAQWPLFLPALAAFAMYSLVHVENRHIAPFITVAYLGVLSAVVVRDTIEARRLVAAVAVGTAAVLLLPIGPVYTPRYYWSAFQPSPNAASELAKSLAGFGLCPGDQVATTTYANLSHVAWARLLRVQVVAEVYHRPDETVENSFWEAPKPVQDSILRALAARHVKLVVADDVPTHVLPEGWARVPNTRLFVHSLQSLRMQPSVGHPRCQA
jgi:hypothetical protein